MESLYDHISPEEEEGARRAAYLSFDEAHYAFGKLPCQWLVSTFYIPKLNYCVKSDNGVIWSVSKKQIKDLMSDGQYVWVKSREFVELKGEPLPNLEVCCCSSIKDYRPAGQYLVTRVSELKWLGQFWSSAKIKGRARVYYHNGKVGRSVNLNNIEKASSYLNPEQSEAEAIERSAEVWAQAHDRARGY